MTATFRPTCEWQDVPPGAVLPPGCQIQMNLETGRQQARLAPNGSAGLADLDQAYEDDAGQEADPFPFIKLSALVPNLDSREIVKGVIPRRALGEIYAPPGAGKTAIAVDLLLHVAAGLEYRGRRTEQQPVVYVILEGHGGIVNRVLAAAQNLGIADEDHPFVIVTAAESFRAQKTAQRVAATATALMTEYGGDNPVIAVDTFQAALGAGGSDCKPEDVSILIEHVKRHLIESHCTVLLLHHTGKDASRGARGWSGLLAALDFELEIDRTDDLRTMRVSKSRDGSDSEPAFCYELEPRTLGEDQYGDPVNAVVVRHLADEERATKGKKLSPKARAALNVLWTMIKDRSLSHPIPGQPGLRCVLLAAWEAECIKPDAICKVRLERDRAKKFRAAHAELTETGAITCDGTDGTRIYPTPKPRDE